VEVRLFHRKDAKNAKTNPLRSLRLCGENLEITQRRALPLVLAGSIRYNSMIVNPNPNTHSDKQMESRSGSSCLFYHG
jgi:hypothetical protein